MKILTQIAYQEEKKTPGDSHSDDLSTLLKNSTGNNNDNGPVVGQKIPIANNDGGNNTPAKIPCCQNSAKTVPGVEVDLAILNHVDQVHQTPQNLDDSISERLAIRSVIKKHYGRMKKLHEILLIPQSFGEICTLKLNREIFCNSIIPVRVKRADKRSQNCKASAVKATTGMIKM